MKATVFHCISLLLVISMTASGQMAIKNSSNSDVVYVTQNGNVGIGTTSPAANAKLDVNGFTKTISVQVTNLSGTDTRMLVTNNTGVISAANSTIENVANPGGNIDVVPAGVVSVSGDNAAHTITVGTDPITFEKIFSYSNITFTVAGQQNVALPNMSYTVERTGLYLVTLIADVELHPTATQQAHGGAHVTVNGAHISSSGSGATWAAAAGLAFVRRTGTQSWIKNLNAGDMLGVTVGNNYPESSVDVYRTHTKYILIQLK